MSDVFWHEGDVRRADREARNGHRGAVLWFTGLPAAGKSTIARALERDLHGRAVRTYVLDGDNLRHGLNADLGFSPEHRAENVRRIGEVALLLADAGVVAIGAAVSPYATDRDAVRRRARDIAFFEVFVDAPVDVCAARDPKLLYERARRGEIASFTGVSAPYEAPRTPDLHLDTTRLTVRAAVATIREHLERRGILPLEPAAATAIDGGES